MRVESETFGDPFQNTFQKLTRNYYGISDLGLTLPNFKFDQNLHFLPKSFNFDETYLNTGLKTQNLEELSLDLIFHNHI